MTKKQIQNRKESEKISGNKIERVSTGIPGLDELIEGGYVKGSVVMVTGGTGTGKTTFCSQFLWDGLKKGESGVYVTFEQEPEDIKEDMKVFGMDFEKYEKEGKFKIIFKNPFEFSELASSTVEEVTSLGAKRIVIDPISIIGMFIQDEAGIRKKIFEFLQKLKKTGATILVTSEILENEIGEKGGSLSRDGVVEFIVDGVIVLNLFGVGEGISRSLLIRKMRRTKHDTDVYPMIIDKNGISIKNA